MKNGPLAAKIKVSNHVLNIFFINGSLNTFLDISVAATVPGGIYSDLLNAGILNDLYYRFNDIKYRWVAKDVWAYQTKFSRKFHLLLCKLLLI